MNQIERSSMDYNFNLEQQETPDLNLSEITTFAPEAGFDEIERVQVPDTEF